MLGRDAVIVRVAGEDIVLRPSLRVALALHRRHGGFDRLARLIAEQRLSTCCDLIGEYYCPPFLQSKVWDSRDGLTEPLLRFVFMLAGVDPDNPAPADKGEGELLPHDQYLVRLFERATGWLGWTPEQAWSATPAEIEAACKGRAELLRLMFGGSDTDKSKSTLTLDEKLRLAFGSMSTKVVRRADA